MRDALRQSRPTLCGQRRLRGRIGAAPRQAARLFGRAAVLATAVVLGLLPGPMALAQDRAPPQGTAAELRQKQAQVQQLGRERSQAEGQLARMQASESELRLEIETLSDMVRDSHRRKGALERRIQQQQAAEQAQGRELQRLEREVRAGKRRIGLRLWRLYRLAKQGRSAILFQMARFRSFPKDSRYVALLQNADRMAIAQFEALNREAATTRLLLQQSVQRLLTLREELEQETLQLVDRERYLRDAMADVTKNRALYRQYVQDVERMMTRMESAVTRLETEARTAAPPARPKTPAQLRGSLPPPAQGEVIARFGQQDPRYDLKKRQRGIVLRVAAAAAVTAVAPGRAMHAGPFRGYQSLVVLDHGEGLFTVYGHLEELAVKRGDWVPQGTVLGQATYQPLDEAYDVYFEVRYNGKPDDPLQWLQAGPNGRATGD